MGQGIELAKLLGGNDHAALIDNLKDQLLIAFLKRLVRKDGTLRVPVDEIDATGSHSLAFHIEGRNFVFELRPNERN